MTSTLSERVLLRARQLGFEHAAILTPDELPAIPLERWIAEGRHASLDFMTSPPRHFPRTLLPGVRSILALSASYYQPAPRVGGLRIARYARGLDYHDLLRQRLDQLAAFIQAESGASPPLIARPSTDSAPLLERALAQRAGLGWIGKNTLLIHPRTGSFSFLAELLLDVELEPTPITLIPDRCGRCSRCIDACPTQAIVAPYLLDARRCIAYWNIEASGPIPRDLRPHLQDLLFGCDICQEVCPWNHRATPVTDPALAARPLYAELSALDLLAISHRQFNRLFAHTPLLRARRAGLARNAAVVLGNQHAPALLAPLTTRLALEDDPLVRGHIAWAMARTQHPEALDALRHADAREPHPYAREELRDAIEHLDPY